MDAEERLAMTQVEDYRTGSLELAKELKCSSISRLDYDASNLATALRGQRQLVTEAKLHLSDKSSPASRCKQVSDHIEKHRLNILAMLDNIQY